MTIPRDPSPPPSSMDSGLDALLERLDALEGKIDRIAAHLEIDAPGEAGADEGVGAVRVPAPAGSPGPARDPFLRPRRASVPPYAAPSSLPYAASRPSPDLPPDARDHSERVAGPHLGGAPGHSGWSTAAALPTDRGDRPVASGDPDGEAPPPLRESHVPHRRSEGDVGRYLLSGAAALLVVLAAVTLLALVWTSIPDEVKVLGTGLAAAVLVAAGALLCNRGPRQRVAGATVTGTGGALGFVAIIGAVILRTQLPSVVALLLMGAWGILLLIVSRATRTLFTAVVSSLGAMVAVGFAAQQAGARPEAAISTWTVALVHLAVVAAVSAWLSRSAPLVREAAWFPATVMAPAALAAALTPLGALASSSPWIATGLAVAPVALVYALNLDSGPRLRRARWSAAGAPDWVPGAVLLLVMVELRLSAWTRAASGARDWETMRTAGVVLPLLLLIGVGVGLLLGRADGGWARSATGIHVLTTALAALGVLEVHPGLFVLEVLALAVAGLAAARRGWASVIVVLPAAGLLVPFIRADGWVENALLVAGLLLAVAGAVALEQRLVLPVPLPSPGPVEDPAAQVRFALRASTWVIAADLALVAPVVVGRVLESAADASALRAVLMGLGAIALAQLGLFSAPVGPTELLTGRARRPAGGRSGALDASGTPAAPAPTTRASTGFAFLGVLALVQLAVGEVVDDVVWAAALVVVALGLVACATTLVRPWIRDARVTLLVAGLASAVTWWSVALLTGEDLLSVTMSVVILLTGAACIVLGFRVRATMLRHYGLALTLVAVLKLAVLDLGNQSSITRVLALFVGGLVCFLLSLAYNRVAGEAEPRRSARQAPGVGRGPQVYPGAPADDGAPAPYGVSAPPHGCPWSGPDAGGLGASLDEGPRDVWAPPGRP